MTELLYEFDSAKISVKLFFIFIKRMLEGKDSSVSKFHKNYKVQKKYGISLDALKQGFKRIKKKGVVVEGEVIESVTIEIEQKKNKLKVAKSNFDDSLNGTNKGINVLKKRPKKPTTKKPNQPNNKKVLTNNQTGTNVPDNKNPNQRTNLLVNLEKKIEVSSLDSLGTFKIKDEYKEVVDNYIATNCKVRSYMTVYPGTTYESASTLACRLFGKVEVQNYLEIRRSMLSADRLKKIEMLVDELIDMGTYNFENEKINTDRCDGDSEEDKKKNNKFIREIHDKNFVIKNSEGSESLQTARDYKFAPLITPSQKLAAATHAIRILKTPNSDNGIGAIDPFIQGLWIRFSDKGREDSITALDFAHELTSRNYEVPEIILTQAKREIELQQVTVDEGDIDISDVDYEKMEVNWTQYKNSHQEELKTFLPEREQEIQDLYKKHGYDEASKPVDEVINDSNLIDPGE